MARRTRRTSSMSPKKPYRAAMARCVQRDDQRKDLSGMAGDGCAGSTCRVSPARRRTDSRSREIVRTADAITSRRHAPRQRHRHVPPRVRDAPSTGEPAAARRDSASAGLRSSSRVRRRIIQPQGTFSLTEFISSGECLLHSLDQRLGSKAATTPPVEFETQRKIALGTICNTHQSRPSGSRFFIGRPADGRLVRRCFDGRNPHVLGS